MKRFGAIALLALVGCTTDRVEPHHLAISGTSQVKDLDNTPPTVDGLDAYNREHNPEEYQAYLRAKAREYGFSSVSEYEKWITTGNR